MADKNPNLWSKLLSTFSAHPSTALPSNIGVADLPKFAQQLEQLLANVTNVLNDQYASGYPVKLKLELNASVDRLKALNREISALTATIQRVAGQIACLRTKNEALREQVKILRSSKRRKLAILRDERAHSKYLTESLRTSQISRLQPAASHDSFGSFTTTASMSHASDRNAVVPFVGRSDRSKKLRLTSPERREPSSSGIYLDLSPIRETLSNTEDDDDHYETLV